MTRLTFTIILKLLIVYSIYAQNMGVKLSAGSSPSTTLDVNGAVAYREGSALSLSNGVNSNVALSENSLFRVTGPTAAFSITGFTGGVDGKVLTIINATSQTMSLTHQATSSATNQINTGGSTINIGANGVAFLIYNSTLSKWVLSGGQGFTNTAWNLTGNSGTTAGTNFVGTTDGQDLVFKTNNTEGARFTTTGRLGIGTTSPASSLHFVSTNSGLANDLIMESYQTDAPFLVSRHSRGTPAAPVNLLNGDEVSGIYCLGQVNGTSQVLTGMLSTYKGNGTNLLSNLDFLTSGTSKMLLDENGNLGIGIASPNQQLEITAAMRMPSTTSSTTGVIYKGATPFIHNYKPSSNDGYNTFVGLSAGNFTMSSATSWLASGNTGIGYNSLNALTSGGYNTAIGNVSLDANTTGSYNTAIGNGTLTTNISGDGNTAIGNNALNANTASSNTAIGNGSMLTNTSGSANTAVGETSLNKNTIGLGNTSIGQSSMRENISGNYNTALGMASLQANTSGIENTAIGVSSLVNNLTGSYNVALGNTALSSTTSSNNVAIGYSAGTGTTSGNNNTFVGHQTGLTNTTGSTLTLVGYTANVTSSALTNATAIGANASVSASNSLILGNSANVGIGVTAPSVKLQVDGGNATATYAKFTAGTTTGQTTSDGFDVGVDASGNAVLNQKEALPLVMSANNAEVMRLTSAGNVLIGGNLTPAEATGVALVNQSSSDQKDDITITTYNTTTTPAIVLFKARGTAASPSSLTNSEELGGFNVNGHTGSSFRGLTSMTTITASDFTTSFGADIVFRTSRNGTSSEQMRITSTGNIGIGINSPSHILHINGQGRSTNSAWATTSDRRLKDIESQFEYGLKELMKINTYRFRYKKDNPLNLPTDKPFQGVIAQELEKVIPEAVQNNSDGYLTVNTDPVFWTMLNSIKELKKENETLNVELDNLKAENAYLKQAVNKNNQDIEAIKVMLLGKQH